MKVKKPELGKQYQVRGKLFHMKDTLVDIRLHNTNCTYTKNMDNRDFSEAKNNNTCLAGIQGKGHQDMDE